ncbi:MAG: radical SAM protein [Candidatus Korarchaeum sp.]|nr:radical SAM protein [Candidatus Korarchaeum sp.]
MESYIINLLTNRVKRKVLGGLSFRKNLDYKDIFSYKLNDVALNVRIPFCKSICTFCAFPGELYREELKRLFLEGLKKELALYSKLCDDYMNKTPVVRRVYFSGGTPSLLYKELKDVMVSIEDNLSFSGDVALEAHPSDLDETVLDSLMSIGITQISVGVQSFSKQALSCIGRAQNPESSQEIIRRVLNYNFDYVNIDLVFGLDNQTEEALIEDLKIAAELGVDGISTYPLMISPYSKLKVPLNNSDLLRSKVSRMYSLILDYMEGESYKARAIWSFSRSPEKYIGPYEYEHFFGLGPGAWGLIGKNFTLNSKSLEDYLAYLNEDSLPIHAAATLRDSAFLWLARGLYNTKISMDRLKEKFRDSYYNISALLNVLRLLGLLSKEGDFLKLTKKGLIYGNIITKDIVEGLLTKINETWME